MRIGELAGATGVTPRALRHYEQAGLITSHRLANGYRDYPESTVDRVRNIRLLLDLGLTLEDAGFFKDCLDGDLLAGPPSEAALGVVRRRLGVLERRIDAQLAQRDRLRGALERFSPGSGTTRRGSPREPEPEGAQRQPARR
ncbi:MerR family transcriptional regulator [Allokutzneria sp. A3M-2-11 16]|uniref:MerR family transcriptional regulator n=1 Tax=Allokutzneria sp. A3M-2-11 16 TaxID=2962043 RepID=UPI0020B77B36|nr:MerR family transcriptional regulator [Allokutzneria sp. A3M-2-11 16]MCP3805187.1 MerR family transcriptional regulator [Allokutzneria sp. A3M-2-11 16]